MIVEVDDSSIYLAARVHSASWKASHISFCSPAFVEAHTPERQKEYLQGRIDAGGRIYMLMEDGPAGIVSVTGNTIGDLYVLPDRQNRGYGTRLLEYAIDRCEGTPTLWILENNKGAERLYRRRGFTETGRIKASPSGLDQIEFELKRKGDVSL